MVSKKGKVVVLDFDRVIYNTDLLISYLSVIFAYNGLDFEKMYIKVKNKLGIFSFQACLKMIKNSFVRERVKKEVYRFLSKEGKAFLFSDVLPFLRELKKKGATIIILTKIATREDRDFQRYKIDGLGVAFRRFFCGVKITSESKVLEMRWICHDFKENSDIFFVDDSEKEIKEMKRNLGDKVICIKLIRGEPMVRMEVPNLEWAGQTIRDMENLHWSSQEVL